jgi:hypothetical protein
MLFYDICEHEPETDFALCEIEGFRQALEKSAEYTRQCRKLKSELDAAEANETISSWFYEGQIAKERQARQDAEASRWWYLLGGAGGGTVLMLLLMLSVN